MFVEAIEKFEELDRRLRRLDYGEQGMFQGIRKEALMLLENFLPKNQKYPTDLHAIQIESQKNGESEVDLNNWIKGHEEAIGLFRIIIDDLKIKQRKLVEKSENREEIDKYLKEIDRIKNDTAKDLIFEKNNYNYLKRKYDLLQYNYNQLQSDYNVVMGKKNSWIHYFTWVALLSLVVLVFDQIIEWEWFDNNVRKWYLKLSVMLWIGITFLLIPFGKNIRIMVFSAIILVITGLLVFMPFP